MTNVAARSAKIGSHRIKVGILGSRYQSMTWMMAMLQANMARNAKIIIITDGTSHEVGFVKN